ncbi:hypothetical protein HY969_04240 [Candidatus Kaiserbacteria bacterium]|nr:hypothetical protein [Candidatus Kaiserbacteria bacterium]
MMRRAVRVVGIFFGLSLPYISYAQTILPKKIVPCDGLNCTVCSLAELAQNILNAGIVISVFLSAMLFAYAGWLYLTNEAIGQQQKAKDTFKNVVLGLVIILAAWVIVDTLMKMTLGGNYLPWNNVCG